MKKLLVLAAIPTMWAASAFGEPVSRADKAFIIEHFRNFLADPYSLRSTGISDVIPLKGIYDREIPAGICVRFNGKNAYGAYVGIDRLVYVKTERGLMYGPDARVGVSTSTCNVEGVSYRPFPELANIK